MGVYVTTQLYLVFLKGRVIRADLNFKQQCQSLFIQTGSLKLKIG